MAKRTYAGAFGSIDADKALADLKNANSVTAALKVVKNVMTDTYAGGFNIGASKNDEFAVLKVLVAFKQKYGIKSSALDKIINSWDSSGDTYKDVKGDIEKRVNTDYSGIEKALNTYYKHDGTKIKTTVRLQGDMGNSRPIYKDSKGNYYYLDDNYVKRYFVSQDIVDALDADDKQFVSPSSDSISSKPGVTKPRQPQPNTNTTTNTNTNTNTNNSGTGSTGSGTTSNKTPTYSGGNNIYADESHMKDPGEYPEIPEFKTAEELAAFYGYDLNYDNILKENNESTNQLYDTLVNAQTISRNDFARDNSNYGQRVMKDYLSSYDNVSGTAINRAALGANALSTQAGIDSTAAANDYGMLQSINDLEAARDAELASNPWQAKQYYNQIATNLMQNSADINEANIKAYVADASRYTSDYTTNRAYQGYLAEQAKTKYSGLANAKQAEASSAASRYGSEQDQLNSLYNMFLTAYGGDKKQASNSVYKYLYAGQDKT